MMTTFDLQNPDPNPGDALRDEAANILSEKYGQVFRETRADGKKVDVFFKTYDFSKEVRIYVEAKDYEGPLKRAEVVHIWSDYSGIIDRNKPATLLVITRHGLTTDAQTYVQVEQSNMRHQTIWDLEHEILGLTDYVRYLANLFDEDRLSSYYITARARVATYENHNRELSNETLDIFKGVNEWILSDNYKPVAILGGYGAGKTSLAKRLISHQAKEALKDPLVRRPVLIKLGLFSRYSALDGLLAGMFTSEFPVNGFNARHFLNQNEKGKLFLVLDGFDEMKHAMSWPDFRSQIAELNKLVKGRAKVLLLGRPNAFTSIDEHFHVLRGMKRLDDSWRKLTDWPVFQEHDLESFTPDERKQFVRGYLRSCGSSMTPEQCEVRAAEVNALADAEPDIFGKPVHAKILTDLAADPGVDLKQFSQGVNGWQLYKVFFASLAERETDKEARRPINDKERLAFLRELAFWLWDYKAGSTSFSAEDIPDTFMNNLPDGEAADLESLKREYLTGAFLEKKSGDTYYFGHRSFAEFLVAERMIERKPTPSEHATYSALAKDGVLNFLTECPTPAKIDAWIDTLHVAEGTLHLEYLTLLSDSAGGTDKIIERLHVDSLWRPILKVFDKRIEFDEATFKNILRTMRREDNVLFSLLLSLFMVQCAGFTGKQIPEYCALIAAAILERVFEGATREGNSFAVEIRSDRSKCRTILESVIVGSVDRYDRIEIKFNGSILLTQQQEILRKAGVGVEMHTPERVFDMAGHHVLDWNKIKANMSSENADLAYKYFRTPPKSRRLFTQEKLGKRAL